MSEVYQEIMTKLRELTPVEQSQLLEHLSSRLHQKRGPVHSILELDGLGKDIWAGVDAQAYVNQERDSWSG